MNAANAAYEHCSTVLQLFCASGFLVPFSAGQCIGTYDSCSVATAETHNPDSEYLLIVDRQF